jgi:hypothetical protein
MINKGRALWHYANLLFPDNWSILHWVDSSHYIAWKDRDTSRLRSARSNRFYLSGCIVGLVSWSFLICMSESGTSAKQKILEIDSKISLTYLIYFGQEKKLSFRKWTMKYIHTLKFHFVIRALNNLIQICFTRCINSTIASREHEYTLSKI